MEAVISIVFHLHGEVEPLAADLVLGHIRLAPRTGLT
jgi:hypothetical protein